MIVVRTRGVIARVSFFFLVVGLCGLDRAVTLAGNAPLPTIEPNDNQRAAGTLESGTLTIDLRAATGRWRPEGPSGPALEIEALGEVGKPLMVPAPLLRVAEGTEIALSIRNDLAAPLTVHGLCTRGGAACAPVQVPAGDTRRVRFASGPAGTYHYWASSIGAPVPFRELAGAFVVDPPTGRTAEDRILVITEWSNLTPQQLGQIVTADDPTEVFVKLQPRLTFVINGLSWPATERFAYDVGEPIRWRVINLSSQAHPLHLHGFYFEVNSLGNGVGDSSFDEAHRRRVVTQLLPSGGTLTMTWTAARPGNWLFHCHVMYHVAPERRLGENGPTHSSAGHGSHGGDDQSVGMAGMVIGVTVRDRASAVAPPSETSAQAPRRLTLVMQPRASDSDRTPAAEVALTEDGRAPVSPSADAPGPAIVLRRGEPVEITLVNRLAAPTAIHWHGIELDSYYDGVHGFSGSGRQVTPMIEPGGEFVVRFTPPRAGTFIYHTHLHDYRQLSSGLYGPIVVTSPGETFDPVSDHVIVLGRTGLTTGEPSLLSDPESVVMNGSRSPRFVWKAGMRHRIRLINITPDDIFSVALQTADGPVTWIPVAKDGAPVPAVDAVAVPARQTIAVGETYEFEYQAPAGRRNAWLEVRTTGGKWQVQGQVVLR